MPCRISCASALLLDGFEERAGVEVVVGAPVGADVRCFGGIAWVRGGDGRGASSIGDLVLTWRFRVLGGTQA